MVLTATITELEQPHRFDWLCQTLPDGWQSHVHHADSSKGDNAADAFETVVAHMKRKGMKDEDARKAVTIVPLKKDAPAVLQDPPKVAAPVTKPIVTAKPV